MGLLPLRSAALPEDHPHRTAAEAPPVVPGLPSALLAMKLFIALQFMFMVIPQILIERVDLCEDDLMECFAEIGRQIFPFNTG